MNPIIKLSMCAVLAPLAICARAELFDLRADFSLSANPNHQWSFGDSATPSGFELYTDNVRVGQLYSSRGQAGLVGWSRPDATFPYVGKNQSGSTWYQTWHPGEVVLHPGEPGLSIARWTNVIAGPTTVSVNASFRRVEDITIFVSDWYVVVNGTTVDSGSLQFLNDKAAFSGNYVLNQGDWIAFVAGYEVDRASTDLAVSATINAAPRQAITGAVTLQNFSASPAGVPITVKIRQPGGSTDIQSLSTTLDASGHFSVLASVPPGTYDVAVKASHWLRKNLPNVQIGTFGVSGVNVSLVNGDVNNDNHVTLGDFAQLRQAYGSDPSSGNWNPSADLNGDQVVSLGDFAILRSNYGLDGDL